MDLMTFHHRWKKAFCFFWIRKDPITGCYYNILFLLEKFEFAAFVKNLLIGSMERYDRLAGPYFCGETQ